MSWVGRAFRSSIGAKLVVAVTGLCLFGFVVAHLLGNLQFFGGAEKVNHYAQALRDLGPLLWIARIGLLVVAVVHVFTAMRLARANDAARPVDYVKRASRQVRTTSRSMATTGLVILGYALFHLAHFTWGTIYPEYAHAETTLADGRVVHDVYSMMVRGFSEWWVSAAYVAAMVALLMHLAHAIPSFFQTIGFHHSKYTCAIRLLGAAIAAAIFVGYVSIPAAVLLHVVELAGAKP
jgi:succinate dehydrogenase / fumarate reductase cytochrome b subunit